MTREHGDYQSPPGLIDAVLATLARHNRSWTRVLEPTAGAGGFVEGLLRSGRPPVEVVAIEAQPSRAEVLATLSEREEGHALRVLEASVFDIDLATLAWRTEGPLLVVGNPPWVTNSQLGSLKSNNLPRKSNFQRLKGLDAKTGRSNFDLGTAIWLKLLRELRQSEALIGLLCKLTVAREVIALTPCLDLPMATSSIYRFDARRWFGVSVEACLFVVAVGQRPASLQVPVYPSLEAQRPETTLAVSLTGAVVDSRAYSTTTHIDGRSSLTWRQGVKHDARNVMELTETPEGILRNGYGERVDVEEEYVYPLWKGSDVHRGYRKSRRHVIIPQQFLGQNTRQLETTAPRLWAYLDSHQETLSARRSSIYRDKPPFSIFGIGPYVFSSHKLAVAGFYGPPAKFTLLAPDGGTPAVVDDTVYFVPCESAVQGAALLVAMSLPIVHAFIKSMALPGAKRPITKALLQRIDVLTAVSSSSPAVLAATIDHVLSDPHVASVTDEQRVPTNADELLDIIHKRPGNMARRGQLALAVSLAT